MGVAAAEERLARVAALSSDLGAVGTGGKLGVGGHFRLRYVCNKSSQNGISGDVRAQYGVGIRWANGLKMQVK